MSNDILQLGWLEKILNGITGFIALVITVVGLVKLWRGDAGLVTVVLVVTGLGGAWLGLCMV